MSDDNKDMPYFLDDETLVIPFSCPDHSYKYWKKEGKKLSEVLADIGTDKETWVKFTTDKHPDDIPPKKEAEEDEEG